MSIRRRFVVGTTVLLFLATGCGGQANPAPNASGEAGRIVDSPHSPTQGIIGNEAGGTASHAAGRTPMAPANEHSASPRHTGDNIRPSVQRPESNKTTT